MKAEKDSVKSFKFSGHQRLIILLLALAQFIVILDFMGISPLGDILMKSLEMTPRQFALSVSSLEQWELCRQAHRLKTFFCLG